MAPKQAQRAKLCLSPRWSSRKNAEDRRGPSRRSDSALEQRLSAEIARRCWPGCNLSLSAHRTRLRTRSSFVCGPGAIDLCGNCGAERWFCGCYPPEPWGGGA